VLCRGKNGCDESCTFPKTIDFSVDYLRPAADVERLMHGRGSTVGGGAMASVHDRGVQDNRSNFSRSHGAYYLMRKAV